MEWKEVGEGRVVVVEVGVKGTRRTERQDSRDG